MMRTVWHNPVPCRLCDLIVLMKVGAEGQCGGWVHEHARVPVAFGLALNALSPAVLHRDGGESCHQFLLS